MVVYAFLTTHSANAAPRTTHYLIKTKGDKSQIGGRIYQFLLRELPTVSGFAQQNCGKQRKVSGSNSENEASRLEEIFN